MKDLMKTLQLSLTVGEMGWIREHHLRSAPPGTSLANWAATILAMTCRKEVEEMQAKEKEQR